MVSEERRIRVVVVDDHQVFTDALGVRLDVEPDLAVVGTARTRAEALALLEELGGGDGADVLAVDLALGADDGLAVVDEARARWPSLGAVLVTGPGDEDRCVEAVRAGVRGWVTKADAATVLITAIRCVADGGTHVPERLLTSVLAGLTAGTGPAAHSSAVVDRLTSRELDVLRCLIDGMSRREIGEVLGVSPNTVRTHVQNILHKFEVHSALTAVAVARRAGVRAE